MFLKVLLKTKAEHEQAMETVFRSADELLHEKEAQYSQSLTEALAQCVRSLPIVLNNLLQFP